MNDRQLLELAAKAAGISILGPADKYIAQHEKGESAFIIDNDRGGNSNWNPLTDDGDALRLAVKLELHNAVRNGYQHLDSDGDIYAATRRAIVRSAAEIGKEMA